MQPVVVVNAVIFNEDNLVLLERRRDNKQWCLPGGFVETGETVEMAVIREVEEEVGIRCSIQWLVGIYSASNINLSEVAKRHIIVLAFRCSFSTGSPIVTEEVEDVGFFRLTALPDNLVEVQRVRIAHACLINSGPVIA